MQGIVDFVVSLITFPFICMGWLIVGFIAGGLARYLMKSEDMPFWNDIILGLAGALIGGFITGGLLGFDPNTSGVQLVLVNLVVATLAAMVLIYGGRQLFGTKPIRRRKKRKSSRR